MLNRAKYKTRLTQNKKTKHISNAYSKTRRGERKREKKVTKSLGSFFLSHLGRTFPFGKPLIQQRGRKIETVQVRKKHEGFE